MSHYENHDQFGMEIAKMGNNTTSSLPPETTPSGEDFAAAYSFDGSTGELLQTFAHPKPAELDGFGGIQLR